MKKTIKAVAFISGFILLYVYASKVLNYKWYYPQRWDRPYNTINEFYSLSKDRIDAIFLGTSHVQYAIMPMYIYDKTGYATYNLGLSGCSMMGTYYLAKEAIDTHESVKVVYLDVSSLFLKKEYNTRIKSVDALNMPDTNYLQILDNMPMNNNKFHFMLDYSALGNSKEDRINRVASILSPFTRYHSRWKELNLDEFEEKKIGDMFQKGYNSTTNMVAIMQGLDVDYMNKLADINHKIEGWTITIENRVQTQDEELDQYNTLFNSNSIHYLMKLQEYCEERNVELVLFKIPSIYLPQDRSYQSAWTRQKSEKTKALAKEKGLAYIDLLYDADLKLDWTKDSFDGGKHMNYRGAKIISQFMSEDVRNRLDVDSIVVEDYEKDLPAYYAFRDIAELQTTDLFYDYLDTLSSMKDKTIFVVAYDDMWNHMSSIGKAKLRSLGLMMDLEPLEYSDSYIGIVQDGKSVYECASNQEISHTCSINDHNVELLSSGFIAGADCEIIIDNECYDNRGRGINIVVYDDKADQVIDSVSFDTYAFENPNGSHNSSVLKWLLEYEQWYMRKETV